MFFRVVVPPTFHLVAVLLIVFALVSPVPFHASSLSLLYLLPMAAPPHDPPASMTPSVSSISNMTSVSSISSVSSSSVPLPSPTLPAFERRDVYDTTSQAMYTTHVRYTTGLLGSCYVDAHNTAHCTPSRMRPIYNATWLTTEPGMNTDTTSLPTGLTSQPALVLVALLLVVGTGAVQVRRVYRLLVHADTEVPRSTVHLVRLATYVQDAAAVILLLLMIAMRVQAAHMIAAFRADNAGRVLGHELTETDGPPSPPVPLAWDIEAGSTFSVVCVAACLLLATTWLERRRLRAERDDAPPKRLQWRVSWPQRAWATLSQTPLAPVTEPTPHISAPMPLHPVLPPKAWATDMSCKSDSVPSTPLHDIHPGRSPPPVPLRSAQRLHS
ncbi:hypothetical protein MNAN1_003680 [Malassezia nana]|uniref:Uncharacterized protein n=1 Tax=Malassezia nana TaxID=180528 RepID=A0AAF0EUG1_9BASI|nr:hypothetical protein MNAN1_003680 [Malassezia nana]